MTGEAAMARARAVAALLAGVCAAAAVLLGVVVLGRALPPVGLSFLAAGAAAVVLLPAGSPLAAASGRLLGAAPDSPWPALAAAAAHLRRGRLDEVLPGLAQVLTEQTGADRAAVWLAVGDALVESAGYPAATGDPPTVPDLAALLVRPGSDHVVPVLDHGELRAVLLITKSGSISAADRRLLGDLASAAGLLLRVAAANAELAERVRRADELAAVAHASRSRLESARAAERRRLLHELQHVTGHRFGGLRDRLHTAEDAVRDPAADPAAVRAAFRGAREELDELLERFRAVARGVYPTVLRDRGPAAALEEAAADLPRPVRLPDDDGPRLAWELESTMYYLAATSVRLLAESGDSGVVAVDLSYGAGAVLLEVRDPAPAVDGEELRARLADDVERVVALGGEVEVAGEPAGELVVRAWLPDRVEPLVEVASP
jgi:signal transduction histidine kinase